jgi:hypothetical protein
MILTNIGKKLADWRWDANGAWLVASAFLTLFFSILSGYHFYMFCVYIPVLYGNVDAQFTMTIEKEQRAYVDNFNHHITLVYDYSMWIGVRVFRYVTAPTPIIVVLVTWFFTFTVLLVQYTSSSPPPQNPNQVVN